MRLYIFREDKSKEKDNCSGRNTHLLRISYEKDNLFGSKTFA